MRISRLVCTAALAAGLALATTAASAQTLTVGVRGGPESLDPHYSALGPHAEAAKHIYDTLVWSATSGDTAQAATRVAPAMTESLRHKRSTGPAEAGRKQTRIISIPNQLNSHRQQGCQ